LYIDEKLNVLSKYFECKSPFFYRQLGTGYAFPTEQKTYQNVADIPPNGYEITQEHVGNCYNNNICFRQGQSRKWSAIFRFGFFLVKYMGKNKNLTIGDIEIFPKNLNL